MANVTKVTPEKDTQAAVRAGYSDKTARQIGEQNLSKLDIQQAIQQRMQELRKKTALQDVGKCWHHRPSI